jgi:hypothetical protein
MATIMLCVLLQPFNVTLTSALPDQTSNFVCGISSLSAEQMQFVQQALISPSSSATSNDANTAINMLSPFGASWTASTRQFAPGSLFTWFQSSTPAPSLSATVSAKVSTLSQRHPSICQFAEAFVSHRCLINR